MNEENGQSQPTPRDRTLGELAAALAKAQGEYKHLERSRTVKVKMKAGGQYEYKYAPLDKCFEAVREALAKNGLAVVQSFGGNPLGIRTTLMHSSGEYVSSELPLTPEGRSPQELGAEITYKRRYALQALLGMAAEEDTDGPPGDSQSYSHSAARPQREGSKTPESGAAPPTKQGALSQAQLKRLFAISKASGWTTDQLKTYLLLEYRIEHSSDLTLKQYNELCGDKKKKVKGILEDGPPTDETAEPPTDDAGSSSPEDPGTEAGGGYAELAKKILDAQGDSEAMLALAVAVGNSKALSDEDRANLNELISGGKE